MLRQQAHFFQQLAIHRGLGAFARFDASLRKLPRVLAHPLAPEHLMLVIDEDDSDIGAVSVPVQHGKTCKFVSWQDFCTFPVAAHGSPSHRCHIVLHNHTKPLNIIDTQHWQPLKLWAVSSARACHALPATALYRTHSLPCFPGRVRATAECHRQRRPVGTGYRLDTFKEPCP